MRANTERKQQPGTKGVYFSISTTPQVKEVIKIYQDLSEDYSSRYKFFISFSLSF